MKHFLQDFFLSSLFFIVILIIADIFIPLPKNNYSIKRDYLEAHHNEITTLVIGNSLAEKGFDTHVLGSGAYCFAISGRSLYYDNKLMEQYLSSLNNLKTVILVLHYNLHSFQCLEGDRKKGAKEYIYNYYRYFKISWDTFPYGYLFRSAVLTDNFHHPFNTKKQLCDEIGNTLIDNIWDGVSDKTANPPNQQDVDKCIKSISSMAGMFDKRGIRFIIVTPPFPDLWIEGCTDQGIKNLSYIIDSINNNYPIEYKNYLTDSEFRNDSLYCDWNHLNSFGATLFAQRVKDDFGL